jgi:hypothetical protein
VPQIQGVFDIFFVLKKKLKQIKKNIVFFLKEKKKVVLEK